jgi:uncharacterized membrane protein
MSDDNLNEKANEGNEELEKAELITDSPSSALEKVEENNEGPKRRKKPARKPKAEEAEKEEEVVEESSEEKVEEVIEEKAEEVTEEVTEEKVEAKAEKPKKEAKKKPAKKSDKEEEVEVSKNEEAKAPKTMKQRYVDMLTDKNFEIRLKGARIYDSSSKLQFELTDTGVRINNRAYKYSEVVIRIK